MRIKGNNITIKQIVCLLLYYCILYYMPSSTCIIPYVGKMSRKLRYVCCKNIFQYCGMNVNIEHKANFGSGLGIRIGNNSGIGINSTIPSNTIIGDNVMMAPNCYILSTNHSIERIDIPMIEQGETQKKQTIIEDDVWIGRNVIMTPGRIIKKGSVIAAGCVLTKDFLEYSIIGGNPCKLIRSRIKSL